MTDLRHLVRRLRSPPDVQMATRVALLLLLGELVLCGLIIWRVPYTEIDWEAYMQQSALFTKGERDYEQIKGGTGPLVYPAGFLYLYTALRWLTGAAILPAQLLFALFYLVNQALVLALYIQAQVVPPWALPLLCLSKRVHSIFLLRLFNDGPAVLLAHAGAAALLSRRPRLAVLLFSAATSVKMSVLLMAPSVLVVLLKAASAKDIVQGTAAGVLLQLVLGAPFLVAAPASYLRKAFELSRVFLHQWTVNLHFLPEEVFQSRQLAACLLAAHLLLLWLFLDHRWCAAEGGAGGLWRSFTERIQRHSSQPSQHRLPVEEEQQSAMHSNGLSNGSSVIQRPPANGRGKAVGTAAKLPHQPADTRMLPLDAAHVLLILFSGNFVGIVCARTLHYQFYAWYFQSLPLLLWSVRMPSVLRVALWVAIETVWNVYPPTAASSLTLLACHGALLAVLLRRPVDAYFFGKPASEHDE